VAIVKWIEALQKLVPWAAGLTLAPKLAISLVIFGLAALALGLMWNPAPKRNQEVVALPKRPSNQGPPQPLGSFVVGESTDEIRNLNGVRELQPLEDDLDIARLPNGVFGFIPPWSITTRRLGAGGDAGGERISLHKTNNGATLVELHKSSRGEIFVLAYVTEDILTRLQNPTREDPLDATLFFAPYKGNDRLIGIPTRRLVAWEERSPSEIGDIADIRVR